MKFRKLGNSGLEVSPVSLGTWVFGGDCWGQADDGLSERVVHEAIDSGINMIDTAPVYGSGRSEDIVGKAIKGKRNGLILATKCGLEADRSGIRVDLSPAFIRRDIEGSLKRLKVDVIDLYQCHWPDKKTPLEQTFGEMNKLVREGKIRAIGVSNFDNTLLSEALDYADIASNQVQYSLFDRSIERGTVPLCEKKGVSILAYGPLGGGILTGKYTEPPRLDKGDVRSFFYRYYKEPFWSRGKMLVSVLARIAENRKVNIGEVALNWVLSRDITAAAIAGCRTPDHVIKNASAMKWRLSAEELSEIEEEYKKVF